MTLSEIAALRLSNQHVKGTKFKKPKEIVRWMGAIQAQDYSQAKWAVGVRLPGSSAKMVEDALDKGEIIRTHVLRPTWHFVTPEDVSWMVELTAPRIRQIMKSGNRNLGLTESIYAKSRKILERELSKGSHLTRQELMAHHQKAGIPTDTIRAAYLMMHAELDTLVCSGRLNGKEFTYALIAERTPKTGKFDKEKTLAMLAERYIRSHGPATVRDFGWWSGLSSDDCKRAFEMVKSKFVTEKTDQATYFFSPSPTLPSVDLSRPLLLPAFDEYIIGYKNRTAALDEKHNRKIITVNGIFKPLIVVNGKIEGLWKRNVTGEKMEIDVTLFAKLSKAQKELIKEEINRYCEFHGKALTKLKVS